MRFKEYIERYRQVVYSKICEYVPLKEPIGHYRIMRDYIDRQGSYRRPGLVLLSGQMFGETIEKLILPAAAQQLSEDWILLQDDAEDDSELRRGKPAAQKLYGWVHTVNASNTGQIAMWKMLKDFVVQTGEIGNRVYEKFYDMLAYTVEGQYLENEFIHHTKDLSSANEDFYYRIADSKTCYYTVYGPLQIGALAAGVTDEKVLSTMKEIGRKAGISFQIMDDVLDMTGDEAKFGKKRYGDLYEGKVTLIILHTFQNANNEEKEKISRIYKKKRPEKTQEEIQFLIDMIEKYGGIEYAKSIAKKYTGEAEALVKENLEIFPNNEYRDILITAIEE
ncbi:MAG: polyprenyl synthetase family protein, partial [Candidatus Micrarchaeaceae archaeon]